MPAEVTHSSLSRLADILVQISRTCQSPVEHLRAEQLLREASESWPGDEAELWNKWLAEACRCLNLRAHDVELDISQACRLAEDGAAVVGLWQHGRGPVLLVEEDDISEKAVEDNPATQFDESESAADKSPTPQNWLVVENAERFDARSNPRLSHRPLIRLMKLLHPEWNDIWIILVFAFFAAVLSLSTPIAVEVLVNTVAFSGLLQPVVVLAALLFWFLAFAGVMQALQTYVAEVIQRRLFVRVSADLAYRLPSVDAARLDGAYAPELTNRFLEVATLQKVVADLLLDGINIALATLVGMTLLAFYHPWLLGFDVLLLGMVIGGLVILGRNAFRTSIDESRYKYRLTAWFEDLTRCDTTFKAAGAAEFAADRANLLAANYLRHRRSHFSVLFRQIVFVLGLQVIAGTVLLGGGGWLVIQGQLSLGQIVAAELIVSIILVSMAKIGKHLEGFYDLVAAVDKLGILFDLPVERHDGLMVLNAEDRGLAFSLNHVRVAGARGKLSKGLSLEVAPGERLAIFGGTNSGKSAICRMLYGSRKPDAGRVSVAGIVPTDVRPDVLRERVALAAEPEFFEGTLADNVHLRRRNVTIRECYAALGAVGLLDDCLDMETGLDTPMTASATPLSNGQQRLLMLARAIASKPKLLLIDGTLDGLPDDELEDALTAILNPNEGWTVLLATGRRDLASRLDRVVELTDAVPPRILTAQHEKGNA
jgi:putative ABC transport system ATP-binding protein